MGSNIVMSSNGKQMFRWSTTRKVLVSLAVFVLLMAVTIILYVWVSAEGAGGATINFPEKWTFNWQVAEAINEAVDWVVIEGDALFSAINIVILRGLLSPMERYLLWLPWWSVIIIMGLVAWCVIGIRFSVLAMFFMVVMAVMGLFDLVCQTLAIMFASTLVCVLLGLPLGIIAGISNFFDRMIRPILDTMQTMPIFVYLIPAVMLFGLGKVPAVIATCIYALPPIIRLTNLGIREVDTQFIEVARSFGSTNWQILVKVQIPLALSTIMAGLNQTVMMALGMVVIAAMVGAGGLGAEIFRAISRLEVGRGLIAGVGVVFIAVILDRISQGLARSLQVRDT
ncbi:MAG: ABC transporter permease subunit [Dehalococcoidales bacterium]|nr:ABC transporter permease subunit [Dehalococcoidales bacterium]